jgi:diguanylate cyclase (GGDEF)-like protein
VDIAGRIGCEEFAVLLPETGPAEALDVAERLRAAIAAASVPMKRGLPVKFSVSIGVTSMALAGDDIDALLDSADRALYAAKNAGRNRVVATRPLSQ